MRAFSTFGHEVRSAISEADELDDAGTADLFTEISRGIDKWLWFVEAHSQAPKRFHEDSSNHSLEVMTMRALLYLLFLACLALLLFCLDLVPRPTSNVQAALLSVRLAKVVDLKNKR